MYISPLNNQQTFCSNLKSPKLKFSQKDFFVKIKGYGKNKEWAKDMIETADITVSLIRYNYSIEKILRSIAFGVRRANNCTDDYAKIKHSGILRIKRDGWRPPTKWVKFNLCTNYDGGKYKTYAQRLDYVKDNPIKNPYPDIDLSVPCFEDGEKYIRHGNIESINNVFTHVAEMYKDFSKFTKIDVQEQHLPEINDKIANIRWVLAHSTPWERGSDSISNVLMRAMYKAVGVKSYPLAKGVSLDMEAFCTDLSEYKKNFSKYFVKPPKVIPNKKESLFSRIKNFFKD